MYIPYIVWEQYSAGSVIANQLESAFVREIREYLDGGYLGKSHKAKRL